MTPEQIAALTPEQLKIEIAKRLGWHNFYGHGAALKGKHDNYIQACYVPDYCVSIAAAWELFTQFGNEAYLTFTMNNVWVCGQYLDGVGEVFREESHTAPIAICRAWLMWKEQQP